MKRILCICTALLCLSATTGWAGGAKAVTFTTLDVKVNYEIIQIITGFAEIAAPANKDNFMKAYAAAWTTLGAEANKVKADAVVGIKVEFMKSTDGYNDKVVVYGTAVKYR